MASLILPARRVKPIFPVIFLPSADCPFGLREKGQFF
jgi:hypothetical protein